MIFLEFYVKDYFKSFLNKNHFIELPQALTIKQEINELTNLYNEKCTYWKIFFHKIETLPCDLDCLQFRAVTIFLQYYKVI
jgi:hypothetical protein